MRFRGFIPMAVVCAGVCAGMSATAAFAVQAGSTPLQLKKFMKTPVSSSATRTVKKPDGQYAQLAAKRLKKKVAATQPPSTEVAPDAANAFASDETQVRLVSANEVNEIDLAADASPIVPVVVPTSTETVQVVAPNEINTIDQAADKETVAMAPAAEPQTSVSAAINIATERKSWVQRMLDGLHVVVSAATAAAKALFA